MKRMNIFTGFACVILFIYIFMHETDPYFVYDNVVLNVAGFSQLSSSLANGMRWLFNSSASVKDWLVDILDHMFQYDLPDIFERLTYGPILSIVEAFEELYNKLGWFQ